MIGACVEKKEAAELESLAHLSRPYWRNRTV